MMKRKAQGALEFLTTYGWAFLVILIMIGALAYFGVLNPTKFLPERCNINPEFSCEEFSLMRNTDGDELTFKVVLKSNIEQGITIDLTDTKIGLESEVLSGTDASEPDVVCTGNSIAEGNTVDVAEGETFLLECVDSSTEVNLPSAGNKLKVGFSMKYIPQGKTLEKPIVGEVFGTLTE